MGALLLVVFVKVHSTRSHQFEKGEERRLVPEDTLKKRKLTSERTMCSFLLPGLKAHFQAKAYVGSQGNKCFPVHFLPFFLLPAWLVQFGGEKCSFSMK